jgi:hypothetical protein
MKKNWLWIVIMAFGLCLFPKSLPAEDLSAGRAAVFMRDGGMIVGEVVDIASTPLALELRDGQKLPLHQIWMINFVNTEWNFLEERQRLEKDEHYLFFRNDRITSGRIIDLISPLVFQFDTREEVPMTEIRRIYFTNQLPPAYQSRLAEVETGQMHGYVGTFSGDIALSSGVLRTVTLTLNADRTALLTQVYPQGQMPVAEQGSWTDNPDGTITVSTSRQGRIRRVQRAPLVFRLENNELVAVQFDQRIWGSGGLRLKRN